MEENDAVSGCERNGASGRILSAVFVSGRLGIGSRYRYTHGHMAAWFWGKSRDGRAV